MLEVHLTSMRIELVNVDEQFCGGSRDLVVADLRLMTAASQPRNSSWTLAKIQGSVGYGV
jgi:hypothetical protein